MNTQAPGPEASFGERLEWARTLRGIARGELAQAVGSSPSRYSDWTRTNPPADPKLETVRRLARALDVDQLWLHAGVGEHTRPAEPGEADGERLAALEAVVKRLVSVLTDAGTIPGPERADLLRLALDIGEPARPSPAGVAEGALERARETPEPDELAPRRQAGRGRE